MSGRDVLITGIGLVSCLGEGAETHQRLLSSGEARPVVDTERFPPFPIHPLPAIDWNLQIPKRGDQRQMETWQRLGTYAAGLALDDAGIKGDEALCASMDMIVGASGGERDVAVDADILAQSRLRPDVEVLLNEKLTTDLRPTLFLAQLSNLLAGNISIVHKVTGSSRTFMGEEGSGIAAIETAAARIRAGQATHVLVGAAYQTEHPDMLLGFELGGYLHRGPHASVWKRAGMEGGGVVSGSGAAFLVLESRDHAAVRGRKAYAELGKIASGRARRGTALEPALEAMLQEMGADKADLVVSGASGAHEPTAAEAAVLQRLGLPVRGWSTLAGHLRDAQFPFSVALAALAVGEGVAYPSSDDLERPVDGAVETVLATTVGYHYFEGMALVTAAK